MNIFVSFVNKITSILEKFLISLMWIMVLAVIWQVITRFIFNSPSIFTDELSRYLMIWLGILGGAYISAKKKHLAIEWINSKLSPQNTIILDVIINLIIIIFTSIVFIYGGTIVVEKTLSFHQISPGLSLYGHHLPMGYVYLVAPISGVLIVIYSINDILFDLNKTINNKSE